jgi:hypothetical protein
VALGLLGELLDLGLDVVDDSDAHHAAFIVGLASTGGGDRIDSDPIASPELPAAASEVLWLPLAAASMV